MALYPSFNEKIRVWNRNQNKNEKEGGRRRRRRKTDKTRWRLIGVTLNRKRNFVLLRALSTVSE